MCDMENEPTENPLKMHQEDPAEKKQNQAELQEKPAASQEKSEPKEHVFELPTGYLLAAELQEMYDEDKVVHRQGHSEPESD